MGICMSKQNGSGASDPSQKKKNGNKAGKVNDKKSSSEKEGSKLFPQYADPGCVKMKEKYAMGIVCIGKGHYAKVYKGMERSSGKTVAVKVIDKSKTNAERLGIEIDIMRRIGHHPNVVELYDVYDNSTTGELNLVMEYLTGGELFDKLCNEGAYSEKDAASVAKCIANALKFLHDHNIVHRDLKPENLLLKAKDTPHSEVKLADFGLAKIAKGNSVLETVCGTWAYAAPEVKGQQFNPEKGYTKKVDIWSLGVIVFVLISGYHPFDPEGDISDDEMQVRINAGQFDFEDEAWEGISADAKDLIKNCLRVGVNERYDVNQVLNHPWLKKADSHSEEHLPNTVKNIQKTCEARRKFKSGVDAVMISLNMKKDD
eukprot:g1256.t1